MVTFHELHDLRLGKLKSAVTEWKEMVSKLEKLANGGDGHVSADDLDKKAKAADWKGDNARVMRVFTTKTAEQFQDILTEARSVHTVLSGAHSKFTTHKRDLQDVVTRAGKKDIHVTATGTVRARDDADPKPTQKDIDAVVGEIKAVLDEAAETDRTAAAALRFHAKDKYDFGSSGFKSFDAAEQTIKDSNAFVRLTKHDPSKLSNEQLTRLNTLMKAHSGDPVFAERVAGGLGPGGTLKFWSRATDLDAWDPDGKKRDEQDDRTKLLGTMEKRLGVTLGLASRQDGAAMHHWKDQMVKLGDHPLRGDGSDTARVYGFQVMSNLMRNGTYDKEFLNDYGDSLVGYEKKHTGDVGASGMGGTKRENVLPWDRDVPLQSPDELHFGDKNDAGRDPMTGFMKALSNNPDASTDFFSSDEPQNNSKWVLKDRPVLDDHVPESGYGVPDEQKGPRPMYEATGDALTAAATGVDPNDPSAKAPPHTPEHREVLDKSLDYLSQRKDDFPPEMRDDMAKILVNHGDVVHHTASAQADHPNDPKELDRRQLLEVTKQVSRDQDAYGLLNDGLNREMVRDIHQDNPKDPKETLQRAGQTVGFLEEARYQALADKVAADKQDVAWKQTWVYHGAGTAASFIPEGHVAGIVDRGAYLLSYNWRVDEEARIGEVNHQQNGETFKGRENQLEALAKIWNDQNPREGLTDYTATTDINNAASNGNTTAQGLPGRQPAH